MAVRSKSAHRKVAEIRPRSWDATAKFAGLGDATDILDDVFQRAPKAVEIVNRQLPKGFPSGVRDKIFDGFLGMVRSLSAS